MAVLQLELLPGELPPDYCFVSWQQTLIDFATHTTVALDVTGASFTLVQDAVPLSTQRDFLWYDTRVDETFRWNSSVGAWVRRHRYAPGSSARLWWDGDLASLQTFDGGDAGGAGDASGPMWAEDTEYAGRMLLGVGNLPSGAAVALNAEAGLDTLTLAQANLPNVEIAVKTAIVSNLGTGSDVPVVGNTYGSDPLGGSGRAVDSTSSDFSGRFYTRGLSLPLGGGTAGAAPTAISSMPPYRAGYAIKRTGRIFYRAS